MAIIVERVAPGSLAAKAGLQAGDRLLEYAGHPLASPAALLACEENTSGQETVQIVVERDGQRLEITTPPGTLEVETVLPLPASVSAEYESGRSAFETKQFAEAAEHWNTAARQVEEKPVAAWFYSKVGEAWEKLSDWPQALAAYTAAVDLLQASEDMAALSRAIFCQGKCHQSQSAWDAAVSAYEMARQLDMGAGREMWEARSLNNLGNVAYFRGNLAQAEDFHTRALEIRERLASHSLEVADSLNNLGNVAYFRGNLTLAQDFHTRALKIRERLVPSSLPVAMSLNNLGLVARDRSDLTQAQDFHTRALDIHERLAPHSLYVAGSLNNLGNVAYFRGNLTQAQDFHTRALEIKERLAPHSLEVARSFHNLGNVAKNLSDLTQARDFYMRALKIKERLAPNSLDMAHTLYNLGNIAVDCDDHTQAQNFHTRALDIHERLAPHSLDVADSLSELGAIYLQQQQPDRTLPFLQESIKIVEQQRGQISSPDARALLLAQHHAKYAALVYCFLLLHNQEQAFTTLERFRARSLLELLAERRLNFAADAAPELVQQQQTLDAQRTDTYAQLAELDAAPEHEEQIQTLHRDLHALERRQQDLTAALRQTSPRYAQLHYPQPLDLKEAQQTLEEGTLLLSFLVDKDQTFLFAVTSSTIEAFLLPLGREALEGQVRAFRRAVDVRRLDYTHEQASVLGYQLYQQLLAPAQAPLKRAQRLLLCPDGPLHSLPFAALVTKPGRRLRYLSTDKTLHTTVSVTVYAQTRQSTSSPTDATPLHTSARRLLALGDPLYGGRTPAFARSSQSPDGVSETLQNVELTQMQTRGLSLSPLPHTRAEVQNLLPLFGESARVKVGAEATKTAALAESGDADIVHLACHGWLDAQMPLSSGLILSLPEALGEQAIAGDNGMLQAWEIIQKVTLKADLVVLSACQTGLGQEVRGEGLIGLTRAFQYAGAKSLLVTLWEIGDASTAVFMEAFYTAWQSGKSKDAALREGIQVLQEHPQWNHPFYWSAFVLIGDPH